MEVREWMWRLETGDMDGVVRGLGRGVRDWVCGG